LASSAQSAWLLVQAREHRLRVRNRAAPDVEVEALAKKL
jgi:hypothetical protein